MVQELKSNPLVTVLLAILVAAMAAVGAMQQNSFNQLWSKLDRVTDLMLVKEATLRQEIRDSQKMLICTDQEVQVIKEKIRAHLAEYDRTVEKNMRILK